MTDEEWRGRLTPEQYRVARLRQTEPAFQNQYWAERRPGIYRCICCGQPLFGSEAKYDSGSGWPSFLAPLSEESIETEDDTGYGMMRTEVHCSRCGSHLGHLFDDGPAPTGLRYCLNSASLEFNEVADEEDE